MCGETKWKLKTNSAGIMGLKSCVTNEVRGKGGGSGALGLEQCFFIQKPCPSQLALAVSCLCSSWAEAQSLDGVRALWFSATSCCSICILKGPADKRGSVLRRSLERSHHVGSCHPIWSANTGLLFSSNCVKYNQILWKLKLAYLIAVSQLC